ncbi:SDR family NAD(P)-dependent oxidoreductase [Dyadobacter tibetensis]|uniref:SDR family NAD(P)-dependent oxidoreductase n=1 Tax=Dyadobacter tibetensis TaxID=1211851 RepID=UPI00046E66B5|nr:SDR family oxidoreductase [Dyadobacter tibetensis]
MGNKLLNKIAVVIGAGSILDRQVTRALLLEGGQVAVLAASAEDLWQLKCFLKNDEISRLHLYLTDPLDYIKSLDILAHLKESFSRIDIVFTTLANYSPLATPQDILVADWKRTTEEHIQFYFTNLLILGYLKDDTSLYVTAGRQPVIKGDNQNILADLRQLLRLESHQYFLPEMASTNARYHHLYLKESWGGKDEAVSLKKDYADYIIQLYLGQTECLKADIRQVVLSL